MTPGQEYAAAAIVVILLAVIEFAVRHHRSTR